MRIVAGEWRGRRIAAPKEEGTRPTQDRTREAISSMVASAFGLDLEGLSVLDAFAGSGAVGFELLSRGAGHATFVERDRRAVNVVRANAKELKAPASRCSVVSGDVLARARTGSLPGAPFDVVFLDPPYALDPDLSRSVVAALDETGALGTDVLVVHERALSAEGLSVPGFVVYKEKRHGTSVVELLRRAQGAEE